MQDNDDLRFRLQPLRPRSRQRQQRAKGQPSRTLPVPGLPPIPCRPFWEDVDYQGLRAMPIEQYIYRIRHPRLGLTIDFRRVRANWQRPVMRPCPEGHMCEDPVRYWAHKFMMHRQDWEALLALGPPHVPPGVDLKALLSRGLRVELHCVTRQNAKAHRATRYYAGPDRNGLLKWRTAWGGEKTKVSDDQPRVLQIWEEYGCHIWDGDGVCATLYDIFGDIVDPAVLEAFEERFEAWSGAIPSWPHDLTYEHPFDPADEALAGFDWPAFHKAGIRLAMELKALVGRHGVVIYNGGPHDRSWPLQLDLLIDWPPT